MKIGVNIEKKHLIVFLVGVFVIASGIFVYAGVSGVSHAWDEITGKPETATRWAKWGEITEKPYLECAGTNEALKKINLATGNVACEVDDAGAGTAGLNCTTVQQTVSAGTINCPSGYKVTGGGCEGDVLNQITKSKPSGNGWFCRFQNQISGSSGTAYAVCCK